nr:baseplate J/gp47 family protein [Kosakonia sacchari]
MPEVHGEKFEKLKGLLGNINPNGDSLVGQTIAILAEDDLNIIEALGWLYSGFFISQAEEGALDGLGEGLFLPRFGLTRSSVYVVCLLEPGNTVAAGEDFTITGSDGDWQTDSTAAENGKTATGFVLAVNDAAILSGNTFTVSVFGRPYSTQYQDGDTSDIIIARLFTLIAAAESSLTTFATAYGLMLYAADGKTLIQFSFATDVFDVVRTGIAVLAVYQSDTEFPEALFGYVATDDILVLSNGSKGYLIEDDEQYRARLQTAATARRVTVSASRPGIKNAVLAVPGVTFVQVDNNRGIDTDANGIPGKSVQVFVAGGDTDAIAQAIYDAAAGECGFYGDVAGTATDGNTSETVYFSRQSYQLVFVDVSGDVWDAETTGRPNDYTSVAINIVQTYFASLAVAQDVFAKQIEARLMMAFPTLTDVVVNVGIASLPAAKTVSIGSGVIAVTDISSITVA